MGGVSVDDYYEDSAPAAKRGRQSDAYGSGSSSSGYGRGEVSHRGSSSSADAANAAAYAYEAADAVAATGEAATSASDEGYCICAGTGTGDMIMCDNPECKIGGGWFHLACVGLTESPGDDASWYCPNCRPLMAKSRKSRK